MGILDELGEGSERGSGMGVARLLISLDDRGKKVLDLLQPGVDPKGSRGGPLAASIHQPSEEEISSSLRTLLRRGPVQGLEVRLIGELQAEGTLARMQALKESVSRLLPVLLPGIPAYTEILLIAPHEKTAWTGEARAFLANHQAPLLWLVSPFNGRLLGDEELDRLCARFLALDLAVDLPRHLWGGERPRRGIASFGLSGLVVPAEDILHRAMHRLAADALALMASLDGVSPGIPSAEQWLGAQGLRFGDLVAAIRRGAGIPLAERERKVVLKEGEEHTWPDRLWSVFYFFGFEGLARQDHRIAANRDQALAAALKALGEKVDDLVVGSRSPASALGFLESLAQAAAAELGERMEVEGAKAHLSAAIGRLREAYSRLPTSYPGLLLRAWVGAFAVAYSLHLLIPLLRPLVQGHPLLSFWGLWLLLGLLGSVAATLFYMERRNDFGRARLNAEGALWEALESVTAAKAHNSALDVLNTLVCAAASPAQREELRTPCRGVPSEHDEVVAYLIRLREASKLARQRGEEPIDTAPFLELPTRLPEAIAGLRPELLADRLVADGFHRGWRDAGVEGLVGKAVDSIGQRVSVSSVPTVLEAFPAGPEAFSLVSRLTEGSRPLLPPSPSSPPPRRLVFAHGADGSPIARIWREVDPHSEWRALDDPYQLLVLSVVHGLSAGDLMGETPGQTVSHDQRPSG